MSIESIMTEGDDVLDEEDYEDDEDFTEDFIIRAKWAMDGATTLAEAAEMLEGYAQYLLDLALEGWTLTGPIEDDYGFLVKG